MRNKKEQQNIQILYGQKTKSATIAFAKTPNIEEAAGALLNAGINNEIRHFYNDLADGYAIKI